MKKRFIPIALLALVSICGRGLRAADAPAAAPGPSDRPIDAGQGKTLYVVGYAHLDTQWRWSYPQVIREYIASTLHDNFALIEKYPDYVFNFSGSRRYEFMQEYYPAEFEKLKAYVAAGRWFPCGSSVDEADANVPSAESLVRQVLYGNRYFRHEFGVASEEFMLPDCFGFPAALPSILAHCGIKGFSTQKLTWGSAVGIPFKVGVWLGPDGKGVVASLDPGAYTGKVSEDLSQNDSWLARIESTGRASGAYVDYHYFGTGDKGGAPDEKSVEWIEKSLSGKGPVRVVSGPADRMFRELKPEQIARLPRYQGELLLTNHSAGSVTSAAYMKRWNRKNELLADDAERASVAAMWLGAAAYPSEKLYSAWDLLLGSQMHDMLPGTSIPKAYEFCWNDEVLAQNQFASVLGDGLGGVAEHLDTRSGGIPLVVYNPLSIVREDPVEADLTFASGAPQSVRVLDPEGHAVPVQILARDGPQLKLLFLARVPSVGFSVFDVQPAASASGRDASARSELKAGPNVLENRRYRVRFSPGGDIASVYDKTNSREILAGPHRLAFQFEKPTQYPAWNMDWADQSKPPRGYVEGPASMRIAEDGPVRVALEVTRKSEGSTFVQTVSLAAGEAGDRVEVSSRIDWQSRECCLKAVFPLAVENPLATYDTQLGALQRGNNDPKKYEVPQHQWFDLTDPSGGYGVAVLNDSKFGSDKPDDRTLRLTLLYTPGVHGSTQDQGCQDQGRHHMVYAIAAHAGDWRKGGIPWQAARLNQPLVAVQAPAHAGDLGRSFSFLKLDSAQVMVTAIKKAEDGNGIVVRLRELEGRAAPQVTLEFNSPVASAQAVDGQERAIGAAQIQGGKLHAEVSAFSLSAYDLSLTPPASVPPVTPGTASSANPFWSKPVALAYSVPAASQRGQPGARFDSEGGSFPAEALPERLVCDGIDFKLGAGGANQPDAVACTGQRLALPEGDYDRVYILAAASDGDAPASFGAGPRPTQVVVPNWTGYIGQWDTRLWQGIVPELAQSWFNKLDGLKPGYVKSAELAWYSSHGHDAEGATKFYDHSYLFKFGFDRAPGVRELTLPNNPRIRIFAVSIARGTHDKGGIVSPLYERFEDHVPGPPGISPPPGSYDDTTTVTIDHPLYWQDGHVHYTLDGSEPTESSTVYTGPFPLFDGAVVKARSIPRGGEPGPAAESLLAIHDTTPPRIESAVSSTASADIRIRFSEPVTAESASNTGNYRVEPTTAVTSATLSADARTVMLHLGSPLAPGSTPATVTVSGVADRSPAANRIEPRKTSLALAAPALRIAHVTCPDQAQEVAVPASPAWTLNFFVRFDAQPANRTVIAGIGSIQNTEDGTGRYLSKSAAGIHFFGRRAEVDTGVPFSTGGWQMLTESYDGHTLTLYKDGEKLVDTTPEFSKDEPIVRIAPLDPWDKMRRFKGELRQVTYWTEALPPEMIGLLWDSGKGE